MRGQHRLREEGVARLRRTRTCHGRRRVAGSSRWCAVSTGWARCRSCPPTMRCGKGVKLIDIRRYDVRLISTHNVNFTLVGPVRFIDFPSRGPGSTARRHVPDVEAISYNQSAVTCVGDKNSQRTRRHALCTRCCCGHERSYVPDPQGREC